MIGGTDPDPAILCWFLQIRIRNTVQYWCLITSLSTAVCAIVAVDIYRYCITCFLLFTYRMDQTIQPTLYVFANPKFYKIFRKVIIIIVFNFCFFFLIKRTQLVPLRSRSELRIRNDSAKIFETIFDTALEYTLGLGGFFLWKKREKSRDTAPLRRFTKT
jgi:hypothetical protein